MNSGRDCVCNEGYDVEPGGAGDEESFRQEVDREDPQMCPLIDLSHQPDKTNQQQRRQQRQQSRQHVTTNQPQDEPLQQQNALALYAYRCCLYGQHHVKQQQQMLSQQLLHHPDLRQHIQLQQQQLGSHCSWLMVKAFNHYMLSYVSAFNRSTDPPNNQYGKQPLPYINPRILPYPRPSSPPNLNLSIQDSQPKPSHSYIGLIALAILSSPEQRLVLSDIYRWITDNHAYFRARGPGWRNSVRHNLSLNDCFFKSARSANGKGHYWMIHPANVEDFKRGDFRRCRAQRKVRRAMGLDVHGEEDDEDEVGGDRSGYKMSLQHESITSDETVYISAATRGDEREDIVHSGYHINPYQNQLDYRPTRSLSSLMSEPITTSSTIPSLCPLKQPPPNTSADNEEHSTFLTKVSVEDLTREGLEGQEDDEVIHSHRYKLSQRIHLDEDYWIRHKTARNVPISQDSFPPGSILTSSGSQLDIPNFIQSKLLPHGKSVRGCTRDSRDSSETESKSSGMDYDFQFLNKKSVDTEDNWSSDQVDDRKYGRFGSTSNADSSSNHDNEVMHRTTLSSDQNEASLNVTIANPHDDVVNKSLDDVEYTAATYQNDVTCTNLEPYVANERILSHEESRPRLISSCVNTTQSNSKLTRATPQTSPEESPRKRSFTIESLLSDSGK